ncbi:MAG: serine/threonine protein kinase [Planctomycetota bacterium]
MTPKTIAKCRILQRLGHGKTSRIFKAFYEPLQKEVAVKVLKEDMKASADVREKFLNEARALARLDHENIVKVFDVVEEKGYLLIIMELLKGKDVGQILREDREIEAERAVDIVTQASRALEAAHRQQIVHRDVKPANLMIVGRREQVKLLDFGLAVEGVTAGKAGTPDYMSPEQIRGKKVEEKSDIYSLGATFFHMLTGRPPYRGKTMKDILDQHLAGKLPSPSRARNVEVPRALDPIVKRMMAPVPGYRFTAGDLAKALEGTNLGARTQARRPRAARAAARRSSTPLIAAAGGVVLVVVVLLVVLLAGGGSKKPVDPVAEQPDVEKPGTVEALNPDLRPSPEILADRAFKSAQKFESMNVGKYDLIIARWETLMKEHPGTKAADKARDRIRQIRRLKEDEQRKLEEAKKQEEAKSAKTVLDEALGGLLVEYKFSEAADKLEEYMLDYRERKSLVQRFECLKHAHQFMRALAGAITDNTKKYQVKRFKRGVPDEAILVSADADGVLIKEGSLEQRKPWSYFETFEVDRIADRLLGYKDPMNLFLRSVFLHEMGDPVNASDWMRNALAKDEFGRVQKLVDKVKEYLQTETKPPKKKPK